MSLPWIEKYRPTTLKELMDQEGVVKSLRNILSTKEVPHMLFTGPPGVGKCISNSTPILLTDGRLIPVEHVKRGDSVHSLGESGRLVPAQVLDKFLRRDRVFRVQTMTGAVVEATGEHPFLTMEDGYPIWKKLSELRPRDWLAAPLKIRASVLKAEERTFDLSGFWAKLRKPVKAHPDLALRGLEAAIASIVQKSPGTTSKELYRKIPVNPGSIRNCLRSLVYRNILRRSARKTFQYFVGSSTVSTNIVPLSHVRDLSNVERVTFRGKFSGFSTWIRLFSSRPDFYEWLGLVLSEGKIERSRILFYNKNKRMLRRFACLTRRVLGIKPKIKSDHVQILRARTLTAILQRKYDVYIGRKKSHNIQIPATLYAAPRANLAAFLRGYFYGDGSFYRETVEIASSSEHLLYQLKVLLLRLGIIARVKRSRLLVSGRENIRNFAREVQPSIKPVRPSKGKAHTNIDLMPLNPEFIRYVLRRLGMNFDEIANRKYLNRLLRRRRSTRRTVQSLYAKIVTKAHDRQGAILRNLADLERSLGGLANAEFPGYEWSGLQRLLADGQMRKRISVLTEIRDERLREYAREARIPRTSTLVSLFQAAYQSTSNERYQFAAVRLQHLADLGQIVRQHALCLAGLLKVSYRQLARFTGSDAGTLNFVLNAQSTGLRTIQMAASAALNIQGIAKSVLNDGFLRSTLTAMSKLSRAEIFWDRVKTIEDAGVKSVCDISVEGTHNFAGGRGLLILHNTAAAHAFARDLYGPDYSSQGLFVEINASVTPDTPILVRRSGRVGRTTVGDLVNRYFRSNLSSHVTIREDLQILSTGQSYDVGFRQVTLLSRHRVDRIVRIRYEGGEVKTSEDHSLMVLDSESVRLVPKRAAELTPGDLLVSFKTNLNYGSDKLDVSEYAPARFVKLQWGVSPNPTVKNVFSKIDVDDEFARFMGRYMAEGCVGHSPSSSRIVLTLGYPQEAKLASQISRYLNTRFGINTRTYAGYSGFDRTRNSSIQLVICNSQLSRFFMDIFYRGENRKASTKCVPEVVFNYSPKKRLAFLKGYMGDSSGRWGSVLRYTSRSRQALTDVAWVCRITGLESSSFEGECRVIWRNKNFSYTKSDLIPASPLIDFLQKINLPSNWRWTLRHQLYGKRSRRLSRVTISKLLAEINPHRLSKDLRQKYEKIQALVESSLYFVEVTDIKVEPYYSYVYDVSVPGSEMFWGGTTPILLHNSDERGIQTIREKVKTFARSLPPTISGKGVGFRILLLDESDQLTDDAQHAFRRTMEQFSATCRFVLAANYSNRIIEPIQSRCAVLRFRPLPREASQEFLQKIAETEKLSITQDALAKVYDSCGGDLRRCINTLQSAASLSTKVDAKTIAKVFGEIDRKQVRTMLDLALGGKFNEARNQLRELLHVHGLSGRDLIDSSFKTVFDLDISEERKMEVLDLLGETDFRIAEGASEEVQFHAFLAKLLPRSKK